MIPPTQRTTLGWRPVCERLFRAAVEVLPLLLLGLATAAGRAESLPAEAAPAEAQAAPARYVAVSEVSEGFRLRIETALDSVPESVWRNMTRHGWQVHLASQVTDAAPQLRGHRPRGWPEDMRWENTDAVHLPREKLVVVAELRENTAGDIVPSLRVEGLLRHELGHAFDVASGRSAYRSASSSFLEAYRLDTDAMSPAAREQLAYYLQADEAGAQETFAEAFAVILGGGCDVVNAEPFAEHFATVLEAVEREITAPEKTHSPPQRRARRFRNR
jgi:hypothetical protein